MKTENFWKIMDTTNGVTVLTYVPKAYCNGDGIYRLMKKLQKVFGSTMNGYQKYDEHHDRLENFNTILRVHYNLWEERLIDATLFEYDPETEQLTVDRQLTRKVVRDWEYTYSWKKTIVKCIDGWNGLRKHLMKWHPNQPTRWAVFISKPLTNYPTWNDLDYITVKTLPV